jgi:heme-degrading monooxygenase HmoA
VGTWQTRADWQAWHEDPAFQETRDRMEGLQEGADEMEWFEVVTEGRERVVV